MNRTTSALLPVLCMLGCGTEMEVEVIEGPPPPPPAEWRWVEVFHAYAPDSTHSQFGEQVALAGGDLYVASYTPRPLRWRLTRYVETEGGWRADIEVRAEDLGAAADYHIKALVVSNNAVWLGAALPDTFTRRADDGEVWRFSRDLTSAQVLEAPAPNGKFGASLAVSEDRLFVGAEKQDNWQGAVHAFALDGPRITPMQVITATAGPQHQRLGASMAVDEDHLYVGATERIQGTSVRGPGAVHALRLGDLPASPARVWTHTTPEIRGIGFAVAATGTGEVVLGAPFAGSCDVDTPECTPHPGDAFLQSAATASTSLDGLRYTEPRQDNELFGFALAANADWIAVGAPGDSSCVTGAGGSGCGGAGAVYVYSRSAEPQRLRPKAAGQSAKAGTAVALDGDRLVVGAPQTRLLDGTGRHGAVTVFEWRQVQPES